MASMFQLDDAAASLDDQEDAWFAAIPMPGDHDSRAVHEDPALTGTLSYGNESDNSLRRSPGLSTVPKKRSSHPPMLGPRPAAQSTQVGQVSSAPRQAAGYGGRHRGRKFPGPAGRLPRLRPQEGFPPTLAATSGERVAVTAGAAAMASQEASSQSSSGCQEELSWQAATADLGPALTNYLQRYSIATATEMASAGRLPWNKVPAMLVGVESMDSSAVDCVATVRDPTGRIQATVHERVFKVLRDRVRPGAALVLRRVTLFSADGGRSHHLNITMDNLVRVYERDGLPPSAAAGAGRLTDTEVRRLEAECFSPRSPQPPPPSHTPQMPHRPAPGYHQLQQQQQQRQQTADKRSSSSPSSLSSSSATSMSISADSKRFRFASAAQQPHQQQQTPRCGQQNPQHHQQTPESQATPQRRQMTLEERELQESYMELLDDNMDDLLASALDDL